MTVYDLQHGIPPPPSSPVRTTSSSSVNRRKSYLPKNKNPDEQARKSKSKQLRGSVNASLDSLLMGESMKFDKPSSWLVLDLDDESSVESFLTPTQTSRKKRLSSSSISGQSIGEDSSSHSFGGIGDARSRIKSRSSSFSGVSKGGSLSAAAEKRRQSYCHHHQLDALEVQKWASMELGTDIDDEEDYEVPIAGGVSTPRKDKSDARKQLMKRQESWAVLQLDLGDLETKSPSARNSRGRKKVRSNSMSHMKRDGSSSSRSCKQRQRSLSKSRHHSGLGGSHSDHQRKTLPSVSASPKPKAPARTKSFELLRRPVQRQSSASSTEAASTSPGIGKGNKKAPSRPKSFEINRRPIQRHSSSSSSTASIASKVVDKVKKLPSRTKSFEISRGPKHSAF